MGPIPDGTYEDRMIQQKVIETQRPKCLCGKIMYINEIEAKAIVAARQNVMGIARAYQCPWSRAWHVTKQAFSTRRRKTRVIQAAKVEE